VDGWHLGEVHWLPVLCGASVLHGSQVTKELVRPLGPWKTTTSRVVVQILLQGCQVPLLDPGDALPGGARAHPHSDCVEAI